MGDNKKCEYFVPVCLSVLEPLFKSENLFPPLKPEETKICFEQGDIFSAVSAELLHFPSYSPRISIGLHQVTGTDIELPIAYVIPNVPQRHYSFWNFQSEQDLEAVLQRLSIEIIEPYVFPVLRNTNLMKEVVRNFIKDSPHSRASIGNIVSRIINYKNPS
jgi:hypothetical protein